MRDSSSGAPQRLRVVQWATGNIGTQSLRSVIEHPDLDLAGLYVHSADKVGRDAGELCGLPTAGVAATGSLDEVIALGADCVIYMPAALNAAEVCAILESGANIVTTRGEFHRPASMEPALRSAVEAACRAGGTSIHSTGSSPGFITEALPIVLSSLQRRLDHLEINEYAYMASRNSPGLLFDVMGFGRPPGPADQRRANHLKAAFGPSLQLLADAVGLPLDEVEAHATVAATRNGVDIAAGRLEAGTVAAQRTTVTGLRAGRPLITFHATWYCATDLEVDWDLRSTGWRVVVDGDTPLDVAITFPVDEERMAATTPGYTAHRAVNAVAVVCAAEPGIRTTVDLPQIIPTFAG